jgi:transposase
MRVSASAALTRCCSGRAVSVASECGRWRTAGTSRVRFERFLIARGERVVRVPTRLMANTRRSSREHGKSDRIDALAAARAALAEGIETLPTAELAGPELDIRLLVDHRERLVRQRVGLNNTLQWHLHDLWPELLQQRSCGGVR